MVALAPHVVRRQEIAPENMRGIDTGPTQQVSVKRRPKISEPETGDAGSTGKTASGSGSTDTANAAPAGAKASAPALVPPAPATSPEDSSSEATTAGQETTRLTKLRFSEDRVEKNAGDSFELPLLMDDAAPMAAELTIEFDPNVLKLEDVAAGVLWGAGGKPTIEKHIQNDVGRAKIRITHGPEGPGAAGSGALLTLRFKSANAGTTAVSISGGDLTVGQNQVSKLDVQNAVITVK